ncbi:TPA: hypothetical protein JLK48_004477 [Escherichia coli]|nr:hypothetical protein [Escherichia coli]HAY0358906.1 hypothetical protein [Escherichia coli]HAY0391599.1 hypothetical protein [Escherichia coli]
MDSSEKLSGPGGYPLPTPVQLAKGDSSCADVSGETLVFLVSSLALDVAYPSWSAQKGGQEAVPGIKP